MTTNKNDTASAPASSPDVNSMEQTNPDAKSTELKEAAQKPLVMFPIVGIGASAGGLSAFESFFSGMPQDIDPGMAFVLVQHLAPDHKSILSELVRRYTRMQVFEVEDGMSIQVNCAYIIPPNCDLAYMNGKLHLLEPCAPRGKRLPIDFFFCSLAQDLHERAICIVLAGTGSDGTLGLRAIKAQGGMVMAQYPLSTANDGMPRSAIATELVDYVLSPQEMPRQLIAYAAYALGRTPRPASVRMTNVEKAMAKIAILLRAQTGHDFSQYKQNTIFRRIERRMGIHNIDTINGYAKYLQQTPAEVEALFYDLLIGVTNFFRDPEAFESLEQQGIPKLFENKTAGSVIRVWSPGCSTGEEAYSIAILLQERMELLQQNHKVQVFATDIDSRAIMTARAGLYPASIANDISKERLERFFVPEPNGNAYRVRKTIRDMMIFSEQNVIKDPPFSKLDLISCRNLLIYLGTDLQKKLIPMFHYALNPGGILFLGTSETLGEFNDLFATIDRKLKLYQHKDFYQGAPRAALGQMLPRVAMPAMSSSWSANKMELPVRLPLRELAEQALLQQVASSGALINRYGDILYLHGRTGLYLEPYPGEAGVNNILKMARDGLRHELTIALHQAVESKEVVRSPRLCVKSNWQSAMVNLTIRPVATGPTAKPETLLYLVILEEVSPSEPVNVHKLLASSDPLPTDPVSDEDANISLLKQELRAKEEYLQTANEELETSNEEMQSMNEELQSTNEELETSKEELQSYNEELSTVNAELLAKVADLSQANNDMNNLLAGTGIGTIFVDHQLRILRFTPAITRIVNLIASDVGRPVAHIASNLIGYDRLVADTQIVLDTLVSKEHEVQTAEGMTYTLRILPYRTLDNEIEGAVITFFDITKMRKAEIQLHEAQAMLKGARNHPQETAKSIEPERSILL